MNALQAFSLNVPIEDLMLDTLDSETQWEWELITTLRADTPTPAELVTFLESRCMTLKLFLTTQSLKTVIAPSRLSQSAGSKISKPSYSNVATQLQCPFCHGSHRLFKCDKFIKLKCLNHAKQLGLCFNCLQPFSKTHTCSKQVCRQCQNKHHTLLHMDRQNQTKDSNLPAAARDSTTVEVNTYCSLKGKQRNYILLATAIVEVRNKSGQYVPCRALLNSAYQSHFISEMFEVIKDPDTFTSSGH